ncbi:hypothetical protein AT03_03390 [Hafnia alvei FB1]|uniref:Uncharacterized protein n=1 Tax=Hafnia alvei FB1 TaxID=1453496 RepID=A0A097QYH3_HAFAL|nr:hypothetical protein AT03_03390 [Hafnia alvei FB1]KKF38793.1 hypothetical protein PU01_21645 [Hafnia alvei]
MTHKQGERNKVCVYCYYLKTLYKFQLISNYFNNKKLIIFILLLCLIKILHKKRAFRLFLLFLKKEN